MIDFKNPLAMIRSLSHFGNETEKRAKRELKAPAEALLDEVKSQLQRPGGVSLTAKHHDKTLREWVRALHRKAA